MSNITITLRDGTVQKFMHEGRPGGSWTKSVRYEGGFVIVEDEWQNTTAFPQELVEKVETKPERW